MEEDADQIVQLQNRNKQLYEEIARLQQEKETLRQQIIAANTGIALLNRILEEHDRAMYNLRVDYNRLWHAHYQLITLYNTRK
jgi:peptidoglycan hydrolase CwlO-like protein